jgi:tryptophan synthase beta chain
VKDGIIDAVAHPQTRVFEAGLQFARTEGIIPAPESAHAVRSAIDEALQARQAGEKRVILFGLSGHGHFDMAAYDAYLAGQIVDYAHPEASIQAAIKEIPLVAAPV